LWIIAVGAVIGLVSTLTAAGWFAALSVDFFCMAIFILVCYVVCSAMHYGIGQLGSLGLALAGGIVFTVIGPYAYPWFASVLCITSCTYLGTTTSPLTMLGLQNIGGVGSTMSLSPLFLLWMVFVVFFFILLALNPDDRTTPVSAEALAIGIWVLSILTILANAFGFKGTEWLLPPLTPFTGFGWAWLLSFLYIAIGVGFWYEQRIAALTYAVLEALGMMISVYFGNWPGLIMNIILILFAGLLYFTFKGHKEQVVDTGFKL
jgi:hypothetical protein